MRKWITLSVMLLALTGCNAATKTPLPQLPKPTIECGEHEPLEGLRSYPSLPDGAAGEWLRSDRYPSDLASAIAALHAAKEHIAAVDQWAIGTAGIFKRNADKFYGVAQCLDEDRNRGLIY